MDLLGILAVVLLTLVGYSSGSVLGAGSKKVSPGLGDLLGVVVLWAGVLLLHGQVGKWPSVGAGLLAGLAVGGAVAALRPGEADPRARLDHLGPGAEAETGSGFLAAWKRFAMKMGNFQGRMMMGFFYFLVLTPFALLSKAGVGAHRASTSEGSFWLDRPAASARLDQARNQF